jgi:hypothetical protein
METKQQSVRVALAALGALAGGVVGFFLFIWIARQGFYALMLPGALLGFGSSLLDKQRSVPRAIACGAAALLLGLLSEWRFAPFIKDASLGYFLSHAHLLRPMTLLMIAGGAALGGWFGMGKPAN